MRATVPYIEKKFEEFNRQIFAGRLPNLPVELSDAKTFLGVCVSDKRRLPDGKIERYNFRLRINTRIDLPEQEIEDTIIHEMIHYFIGINDLEDSSSHGPVFRHMMESINEKYGRHVTISHKGSEAQNEEAVDTRKRWHVVATVEFKDGRTGVKVLPRVLPGILSYYNQVGRDSKVKGIRLFMSNDAYFNRFPNSSALNVTFMDEEELEAHLHDAESMECDGKQITKNGQSVTGEPKQERKGSLCYHVIAVLSLDQDKIGIKVLPRVLPTILSYYNGIKAFQEVKTVELYMSADPYFEKYPSSGKLIYHYENRADVMSKLLDAEHLKCDGSKIVRNS